MIYEGKEKGNNSRRKNSILKEENKDEKEKERNLKKKKEICEKGINKQINKATLEEKKEI